MGLTIAQDLLNAGAVVVMIDIKPRPATLHDPNDKSIYYQGDLSHSGFVSDVINEAFQRNNRLDYLANVAGVLWLGQDRSFLDIDLDVWDQVMTVNLKSMVHTARAAVPLMQKSGGGAMVHFSSTQCLRGDDKPQDAYQASKAGVIALSKSIAVQFGKDQIRSNAVLPGPTQSPMQARWENDSAAVAVLSQRIPVGRVGSTQDMANACLFLLSDLASYITATELIVDGGVTALP